ncbi:MAG: hypothetical protein WD058_03765 [Dehalococcoidia bacterium]
MTFRLRAPRLLLCATGALLLLAASHATPARAQAPEADTMAIEFGMSGEEAEFLGGEVFVFADGLFCASAPVPGEALVLGEADQPPQCATDSAMITFAAANGQFLFETATFEPGTSFSLVNTVPLPPGVLYPTYICDFFAAEGVESTACEMVGPPGTRVVQWDFDAVGIFRDERVVMAFLILVDTARIEAAWDGPVALGYRNPQLEASAPADAAQALMLLQAAGVADMEGRIRMEVLRPCTVWVPEGVEDEAMFVALATALGEEIAVVLAGFGIDIAPCHVTHEAVGDLSVFDVDTFPPAPARTNTDEDSFLAFQLPPPPITPPPVSPTPVGPLPADSGHGVAAEGAWATSMLALAAATLLLAGARRATRPGRRG